MTDNPCPVLACNRPAGDGIICRRCLGVLEKVLAETPWLLTELDIAIAKESRFVVASDRVTRKGATTPLILDIVAAEARTILVTQLGRWTAELSRSIDVTRIGVHDARLASAWLLAHLESVRVFASAAELVEEICSARATAVYTIDRPPERRYLGECGSTYTLPDETEVSCTETLWGRAGDPFTRCKTCGTEWLTEQREAKIKDQAAAGLVDRIMTATQAAETLMAYGIAPDKTAVHLRDRIRKWAAQPNPETPPLLHKRTDLATAGGRKRPGYKLGDIIDIVNRIEETKRARRDATRARA